LEARVGWHHFGSQTAGMNSIAPKNIFLPLVAIFIITAAKVMCGIR
jgi:hypothetical protein